MMHPEILYEDNHIVAVNKTQHDLVQKDITGDVSLDQKIKEYLKEKYNKPAGVFLGVPHRLDRPVTGVVVFARTSKRDSAQPLQYDPEMEQHVQNVIRTAPLYKAALLLALQADYCRIV